MEQAGRRLFQEAREGGGMTDMEFVLDSGRRVRGHRVWLMARCEYIRGMLSSGLVESKTGVVHVRECSEGTFLALLEFIYTGKLGDTCQGQDWGELWEISDLFGMEGVGHRLQDAVTRGNVEDAARVAVEMGSEEMMEKCIKALPSKPASGEEARRVIRVVDTMSQGGDSDKWRLVSGGIGAIVGAMLSHTCDEFVQERGCIALGSMTRLSADIRRIAAKVDSARAVVEALKAHMVNAQVTEQACVAMKNLCRSHAGEVDSMVAPAGTCGGVEAVVQALRHHETIVGIQVAALQSLSMLCRNHAGHISRAERAGGVEAVVNTLIAHRANALVQEKGAQALAELCGGDDANRDRAGAAGGVKAIVEALNHHRDSAPVQEKGVRALRNLCCNHANQDLAGDTGGVEAVVWALKTSRRNHSQEICVAALLNMCFNHDRNKHRAGAAGGVDAVWKALKLRWRNPRLKNPVRLFFDPENFAPAAGDPTISG
jgi:hypothetical protein